jgi:hypothetical protein
VFCFSYDVVCVLYKCGIIVVSLATAGRRHPSYSHIGCPSIWSEEAEDPSTLLLPHRLPLFWSEEAEDPSIWSEGEDPAAAGGPRAWSLMALPVRPLPVLVGD